ncbi:hypothetical protein ACFUIY_24690 [Streptomyces griseorubiginosus]|uniref:hypothetical protein n=1 Tax=Streptomyces griseorubiginosus TaxID=67304 RepID=UPI003642D490
MFSVLSRYRQVPDIAVPDARGRVVAAKDVRPLPRVTGTFTHTVDSGDRLDGLAFSAYRQPLRYWHICDANPAFLSPLDLLDGGPLVTHRFPLTAGPGAPPWALLIRTLSATVGVDEVHVVDEVTPVPQPGGAVVERRELAVVVTQVRAGADVVALAEAIRSTGFTVGPPVEQGRLGRPVVVPAPVS